MKFNDLRLFVKEKGVFSFQDVFKWFPEDNYQVVKNQLGSWVAKGYLSRLRRNLYLLNETGMEEEFVLADQLYSPSYISLESALNYYGFIPDIPLAVTSVSLKKTQTFKNQFGSFLFRQVKPELFFGWQEIKVGKSQSYKIAKPEKALFDFLYLNQRVFGDHFPEEERFSFSQDFNWPELRKYSRLVKGKKFRELVEKLRRFND